MANKRCDECGEYIDEQDGAEYCNMDDMPICEKCHLTWVENHPIRKIEIQFIKNGEWTGIGETAEQDIQEALLDVWAEKHGEWKIEIATCRFVRYADTPDEVFAVTVNFDEYLPSNQF